ncbi:MAG: CDP-diacylglycerol--serine O-phosphatidyltransferase, partial [Bacteroidales bacterium]|nr:CDP-diacylglycerol--serine O-phosphatidyltransferase [Bacteroidales bacterium]
YLKPIIGWWALIALLIAAFSALRLAKFNIDERQTTSFIGLATPPNAIFWASLVCWLDQIALPTWAPWVLLAISLLSCYLLVSEIPFFSFKSAGQGKKHIIIFLVGNCIILGTCATMAITNQQIAIAALAGAICILWYILVNFLTLIGAKR